MFPWHLSVLIRYVDCIEHPLPSDDEQKMLYSFEGRLDPLIKANNNALLLARVTHDCFREIIRCGRDPDAVDAVLRQILSNKDYRREFDYRIDDDPKWEKAAWHLGSRPIPH